VISGEGVCSGSVRGCDGGFTIGLSGISGDSSGVESGTGISAGGRVDLPIKMIYK
jgi:hypothetical protein